MGNLRGLRTADAEIGGLLTQSIPVSGFRLGSVYEIKPRDDLSLLVTRDDVEAVAVVPLIGLPLGSAG